MWPVVLAQMSACQPSEALLVPTAWTYDAPDQEISPAADGATLTAGFSDSLALLHTIDPRLPYSNFESWLSRMGPECPSREDHNNQQLTMGDCEDSSGRIFYGFQLTTHLYDAVVDYQGINAWHNDFFWMTGTTQIIDVDGTNMESMGDVLLRDYIDEEDLRHIYSFVWGNYTDMRAESWLSTGQGVELTTWADEVVSDGGDRRWQMTYDGGISQIQADFTAISLDGLVLDAACPQEPVAGRIGLWDASRRWYWLNADGVCDGCGMVDVDGEPLMEVCVDFSGLWGWEELPWD